MKNDILQEEDFKEPACVLCGTPFSKPAQPIIPLDRILTKYDDHMNRQDFEGAERHLAYWINESAACGDLRAEFSVRNEYMGFLRLRGRHDQATKQADAAIAIIEKLDMTDSVTAGTCFLNSATVNDAAGHTDRALELFKRAEKEYTDSLPAGDPRLCGLYNNYGLALEHAARYNEAIELFDKAIALSDDTARGRLEQAISWLNKADAYSASDTSEETEGIVFECLQTASDLLNDTRNPHDGYYAFVLEKCSPVFAYYGWFADSEKFAALSKETYENIRNM